MAKKKTLALGQVSNPKKISKALDVGGALIVMEAAAVTAYVGFQIGGPVGAAVGALVGAVVGSLAVGMVKRLTVKLNASGEVFLDVHFRFA